MHSRTGRKKINKQPPPSLPPVDRQSAILAHAERERAAAAAVLLRNDRAVFGTPSKDGSRSAPDDSRHRDGDGDGDGDDDDQEMARANTMQPRAPVRFKRNKAEQLSKPRNPLNRAEGRLSDPGMAFGVLKDHLIKVHKLTTHKPAVPFVPERFRKQRRQ